VQCICALGREPPKPCSKSLTPCSLQKIRIWDFHQVRGTPGEIIWRNQKVTFDRFHCSLFGNGQSVNHRNLDFCLTNRAKHTKARSKFVPAGAVSGLASHFMRKSPAQLGLCQKHATLQKERPRRLLVWGARPPYLTLNSTQFSHFI